MLCKTKLVESGSAIGDLKFMSEQDLFKNRLGTFAKDDEIQATCK